MGYGDRLRVDSKSKDIIPLIGVYDAYSASIAGRYYDGIFISGFSFSASHYGLPDIGFIAWPDIVAFTRRVRSLLPQHYIVVDIDDGYGDAQVACNAVAELEHVGASGVILEDQRRPKQCGHLEGKEIMDLPDFLIKLKKVLDTRKDLFVIARTDAEDTDEMFRRARAFDQAGADAVLVDGLRDISLLTELARAIKCPLVFNQISGGKSPALSLEQLKETGVSLVNYSTPCLFSAHTAIDRAMQELITCDGLLPLPKKDEMALKKCNAFLHDNFERKLKQ